MGDAVTDLQPPDVPLADRLTRILEGFPKRRLLVLGDIIADEFIYGQISRVSREAPVLILKYDATEILPGGAGNTANNVASLGARVHLVGLIGTDESGKRLAESFHDRVERSGLIRTMRYRTPTKTRILAGGVHSVKQQVIRIDREASGDASEPVHQIFARKVLGAASSVDAVLVSDYGYGMVSPPLVRAIRARLLKAGRKVPILVDSRYDLLRYQGLTTCTPNESEVEHLLDVTIGDRLRALERAGRELLKRTRMEAVLVTRGSRGMALFEPKRKTQHITIFGSDEIADVTGAGDTVIATMALALAGGASFYEAARLANYAGGIVVMKRGTATVSAEELRAAISSER
ncbi:MAG: bifunctional hydroxymethylpyrimidine kinase/phosphomethylpyrimidine kinase [Acidobacteria bacterium]|nr:bifunctional hydroxymethylpyrimidine kinase/phosphomethylpyrimidine kinase [Acidobacteriota bacterium]